MNVARLRGLNDDFVRRSFRDVADQDYILARVAFRLGFHLQFITLGHQALERYLKAILLFNDRPTKRLGHSLINAYQQVTCVSELPIEIPEDSFAFLQRLDRQASRYFEYSFGATGRTVVMLDQCVWHVRRYCDDMHRIFRNADGTYSEEFAPRAEKFSPEWLQKPHKFRHSTGLLEEILDGKRPGLKAYLVWNNIYYGPRRKVPEYFGTDYIAHPTLALNPDAFAHFDRLVQFSREFRALMKQRGA